MKILVFTEGTILMHATGYGCTREEVVAQVKNEDPSVHDYRSYIPIKNAVEKLKELEKHGHEICYLTSRTVDSEISDIRSVLDKFAFPKGVLYFRREGEEYCDIVERILPNIFIEDDCESIGADQMTYPHIKPKIQKKIISIAVKEFGGIDHLLDLFPPCVLAD